MADKSWKTGGKSNPGKVDTATRDRIENDRKVSKLETRLRIAEDKARGLEKEIEEYRLREEVADRLSESGPTRKWPTTKIKRGKTPVSAIVNYSDWHLEENVDKATVNGLNEYNPKIAERRVKRIFEKTADYIEWFTPGAEVLYMGLLGDFITGYIHEELLESNHMAPIEAADWAVDLICSGVEYLRKRKVVKRIISPTAVGNHGRTTPKKRIKTSCKNSYEWGMYRQIARLYRNDPFYDIRVCQGYHMHTEIYGRTVRWHHGDAIRFGGGVGGITIPANKKIAGWNDSPIPASLDLFGHLHTFMDGGTFVANGSVIGHSDFGVELGAKYEPPCQSFIGFSKTRGKFLVAQMFCED